MKHIYFSEGKFKAKEDLMIDSADVTITIKISLSE
jgi:hypothetical protein